jgi:phasin family protein
MAKTANPFADWDFAKAFSDYKMPMVDVEALMAAQQKNFEAFAAANKFVVEGFQKVAKLQADIMRDTLDRTAKAAEEYATLTKPEDRLAKQAMLTKNSMEVGLTNIREMSDIMVGTANDAVDVVSKRFAEGCVEFEKMVATPAKPATNGAAKK